MSKRKNPFGVITPMQLKVHVGVKEAATREDMEEVYRKTRERLFGSGKENGSAGQDDKAGLVCRCCNAPIKTTPSVVCGSCQMTLCSSSCLRKCGTCGHSFCHFCTVLNNDTPQVRTFCFDCLSSFSFQS